MLKGREVLWERGLLLLLLLLLLVLVRTWASLRLCSRLAYSYICSASLYCCLPRKMCPRLTYALGRRTKPFALLDALTT